MNGQVSRLALHVYRHEFRGEPVSPGFWTVEFFIDEKALSDILKVDKTQRVCVFGRACRAAIPAEQIHRV